MRTMRPIDDIRHERLLELIREAGSVQALADKLGKSHSQISQLKTRARYNAAGGRKSVGNALAREIEATLQLPAGWMDTDPHACCTGTPSEYPDQATRSLAAEAPIVSSQAAWLGAAKQLLGECYARSLVLDPETFSEMVDAALDLAGSESAEAAGHVFKTMLPILARGPGVRHASA